MRFRSMIAVLGGCGLLASACDPGFMSRFGAAFRDQVGTSAEGQMCGDGSDYAALIADCPFEGVCFTAACQAHDVCYNNCAGSRFECDRRFRSDLLDLCNEQFGFRDVGRRECLYFANLYWAFVDATGGEYYNCDFVPTDPRLGACCQAGSPATCVDVSDASGCGFQSVFVDGLTCAEVAATFGGCPAAFNDVCAERAVACQTQTPQPDAGVCATPDGADPALADRLCSVTSQDCAFGHACLPYENTAYRCVVNGDNRLATSDGPEAGAVCGFAEENRLQGDIWYEYTAPCSGTLTVQMCNGTFYDAVLAIYPPDEGGACVCPDKGELPLVCNDDACSPGGPAIASTEVAEGACYVIRVAGYSLDQTEAGAARGISRLDIGVLCDPSEAP